MSTKNDLSRITIDIPKESHRKLKIISAALGKSMREIIIESIQELLYTSHSPNEETLKTIRSVEKGGNLESATDMEDLFRKLGI